MKAQLTIIALAAALALPHVSPAQRSQPPISGSAAQVLVLGTVHLGQMSRRIDPKSLDPLLDRLAAFKPDVIAVEAISGQSCNMMAHYPTLYDPDDVARFCHAPDEARLATGLDVPAAVAQVEKSLKDWPATPTPAQRRHLAALFMAAGDDASALVQWLQLPQPEQHAGNNLNEALAEQLEARNPGTDETTLIAARLAARLGLQRLFPVDDHTGDSFSVDDVNAYAAALKGAWASASATTAPISAHQTELIDSGDMLALYRYINRPDILDVINEGDFGAAMRDTSTEHFGQLYVAGWQTRNLRMVSNVRAAFLDRPGARVLSIVGSQHKLLFDTLLGQLRGVEIVDVAAVLGGTGE